MSRSNAVITGLGVVSSIGIGADEYFDSLRNGRSGVRSLTERTDGEVQPRSDEPIDLSIGAPILGFEPKQYVRPRKSLKVMCREISTAFAASQIAIEDANLDELVPASSDGTLAPEEIATVFGAEILFSAPVEMLDSILGCHDDDGVLNAGQYGIAAKRGLMPLWLLKYLPNMAACHVGISVNAQGPNNSLLLGDVSGPNALIESLGCLDRGIAKVAITGASGTRINAMRMIFRDDHPIAAASDPVANSSRPHDESSQGIVSGEGGASILVEDAGFAKSRGAAPIARIAGYGMSFIASDGMKSHQRSKSNSQTGSRGSAAAIEAAIGAALRKADLQPEQLGLIVSHGTGDPISDLAEREALQRHFTKTSMIAPMAWIGHTGAASGEFGIVTGALCIKHRQIPATLNAESSSESVRLLTETRRLEQDHVLCLSHTTAGSAVAIILAAL